MKNYKSMKRFVLGFLFNPDRNRVTLIQKTHPDWQAGKCNGIGGSIEEGESIVDAMKREFKEETGMLILDWKYCGSIRRETDTDIIAYIYIYKSFGDIDLSAQPRSNETVKIVPISRLNDVKVVEDIKYLIPMLLEDELLNFDLNLKSI